MSININAIHLAGEVRHEHITHLWWTDSASGRADNGSRVSLVNRIEGGLSAYVNDGRGNAAPVGVVTPASGPKYVRTYADGVWTDNLLALPRR